MLFSICQRLNTEHNLQDFYHVRHGITLRTLDFHLPSIQGDEQLIAVGGQLALIFKLQGVNEFLLEGERSHLIKPGSLTLAYTNQDRTFTDCHVSGERYLMVCIMITPQSLLDSPFSQTREDLPQIIQGMFDHPAGWVLEDLSIDLDMVRTLQDLLNSDISGSMRCAYIEAKVIEVICLSLRAVTRRDRNNAKNSYSPYELKALEKIRSQLQQHYCSPPPLTQLAASAGMSESKLKRCFKGLFGISSSEFVLHLRMLRATQELAVRDCNINQIAEKLGYGHACNFTTAFKRRYGLTPKAYQKQLLENCVN